MNKNKASLILIIVFSSLNFSFSKKNVRLKNTRWELINTIYYPQDGIKENDDSNNGAIWTFNSDSTFSFSKSQKLLSPKYKGHWNLTINKLTLAGESDTTFWTVKRFHKDTLTLNTLMIETDLNTLTKETEVSFIFIKM